jgi:hypothetical protein
VNRLQAGGPEQAAVIGEAWVLDGYVGDPAAAQDGAHEGESLREAAADEELVGGGAHGADPPEMAGERLAQLEGALRLRVAKRGVGLVAEHGAVVAKPRLAGEARRVGEAAACQADATVLTSLRGGVEAGRVRQAGLKVGARAVRLRAGCVLAMRRVATGPDPGGRSLPAVQISLGGELAVGLDYDRAGEREFASERPRGWQHGPDRQAALLDGIAQTALELRSQVTLTPIDTDQQIRSKRGVPHPDRGVFTVIGLRFGQRIGH